MANILEEICKIVNVEPTENIMNNLSHLLEAWNDGTGHDQPHYNWDDGDEKSPAYKRFKNKPKDALGNRPGNGALADPGAAREYKYLHKTAKKDMKKLYGVKSGPKGKLPENSDLDMIFKIAGIDPTKGKAKELLEAWEHDSE